MTIKAIEAKLLKIYLRIAMCGESNSGKTFSILTILMALLKGDLSKVYIIDTESRAALYRKIFPGFKIIPVRSPLDPEVLIEALKYCADQGAIAVIIDSASDFWDRAKQIHKELTTNPKMAYYNWAKVSPRWDSMRQAINTAPFHVFSTFRMKEKFVVKDGEMVSEGMKVEFRGGSKGIKFDYQIAFALDENHKAKVGKDNLHLFPDWKESKVIDASVGDKLAKWLVEN